MFYTLLKNWVFDQSERAQSPIYILKLNKYRCRLWYFWFKNK